MNFFARVGTMALGRRLRRVSDIFTDDEYRVIGSHGLVQGFINCIAHCFF